MTSISQAALGLPIRRVLAWTAVLGLLFAIGGGPYAGAFAPGSLTQLTLNDADDSAPQISGGRVVWQGTGGADGGTDYEIFTWTAATGTVQITTNDAHDREPQVSGDRIVWQGVGGTDGGTDYEVFTWTPSGGTVQLTANDESEWHAGVSGDRVVWRGYDNGWPYIYTWTPSGGTEFLPQTGSDPQVSGDRVVFRGDSLASGGGPQDTEIFTWTPGDGLVQLTSNRIGDANPQVSGDRVVWEGGEGENGGSDVEIFTWTPDDGMQQITANDWHDVRPQVSADRVVWETSGGTGDIYSWTPDDGIVRLGTSYVDEWDVRVSGDRVVWIGTPLHNSLAGTEIFFWDPAAGVTQITANEEADTSPVVSADLVVWQGTGGDDEGVDYEIFTWSTSGGSGGGNATSGQITVSAEVAAPDEPVLVFTITAGSAPDGGTVTDASLDFGLVSAGTAKMGSHFLKVTTNAPAGYNVLAGESYPLQTRAAAGTVPQPVHVIPDVTGDDGSITEAVTGPWLLNTTYGFGFTASGTDALFSGGYRQFADASLSETPQRVMANTGPVEDSEIEVGYKLNVSPTQAAGIYTNTLVYVAIGNF
jgi:hypothetical protein